VNESDCIGCGLCAWACPYGARELDQAEGVMKIISHSGFSTASEITQISGRGVGMDVVQSVLRRMSGSINYVVNEGDVGATFIIRLPISLAVSTAIFLQVADSSFAVSTRTIERVIKVEAQELLQTLKSESAQLHADGVNYKLIDLADYLGFKSSLEARQGSQPVILVDAGVQNVAVIVDSVGDTQEIVVKDIGSHVGSIPIYSGATVRADGQVVLLLDLVGLSYYESYANAPTLAERSEDEFLSTPTVMVVDDSLTVRKSAERDISAMGINTVLAKDGLDAQAQLQDIVPDMILLDIEMPGLDGFELLEWIKGDSRLQPIPVVMISSRATDKYVDKASKLGCSAFLGKPYLLSDLVAAFNQHLDLESPIEG
jgi:chemosensory pili system protein ChpA (sensor histidine kinase/response regulator)